MDKFERRRLRLNELIKSRCKGVAAVFAREIEREPSYVSRMLYPEGKAGKKRISDDMMELIESKYDLPRGWLDKAAGTSSPVESAATPSDAAPSWASSSPSHSRLDSAITSAERAGRLTPKIAGALADIVESMTGPRPTPGPKQGDYAKLLRGR